MTNVNQTLVGPNMINLKNESRNALHLNIDINSLFDVCLQKKM